MRRPLVAALAAILLTSLASASRAQAQYGVSAPAGSVVITQPFADPTLLRAGDTYFAFATGGRWDGAFPVASAPTLDGPWTVGGLALSGRPDWVGRNAKGGFGWWAPSVIQAGPGRFLMYYSASNAATGDHCIGVATASAPAGPYTSTPTPFLCMPPGEVIDPFPVRVKGVLRVLYKVGTPAGRFQIRMLRTAPDGLTPLGLPELLVNRLTNVEAPAVIPRNGSWWLFVSAGSFANCSYRTEVFGSPTLVGGTWQHRTDLMTTRSSGRCGPGGAELRWSDGELKAVFHAWICAGGVTCRRDQTGDPDRYRAMLVARIGWRSGLPYVS